MDIVSSYFNALVEKVYSFFWGTSSSSTANQNQTEPSESCNESDIPVTKPAETLVSEVQEVSSPVQTTVNAHSGHYDHPHIPLQYSNSFSDPDETAEVDKINIIVKCAGKTTEVDMFPRESISVLLKEACDRAGKKPEKMKLVYEGNCLDVNKKVSCYGLRGGTTVEKVYSFFWGTSSSSTANQNQTEPSESCNESDIPVTKPAETLVSEVQEVSSPVQTTVNAHSGHYDHPHIPLQYSNSFSDPDETAEVDKINIIVKCAGKTTEVDMFPRESISVLLKEACDRAGKKPEKMKLVYEGNCLDVNKKVSCYGLRGGTTVNLIHA